MSDDGSIYIAIGYDDQESEMILGVYTSLEGAIECTSRCGDDFQNHIVKKYFLDCDCDPYEWEKCTVYKLKRPRDYWKEKEDS